jgi:hypothetical protein
MAVSRLCALGLWRLLLPAQLLAAACVVKLANCQSSDVHSQWIRLHRHVC